MLSSSAFWRTIASVSNLFFSYTMRIWLVGFELNFFYGIESFYSFLMLLCLGFSV